MTEEELKDFIARCTTDPQEFARECEAHYLDNKAEFDALPMNGAISIPFNGFKGE